MRRRRKRRSMKMRAMRSWKKPQIKTPKAEVEILKPILAPDPHL
jgi:hypothetical protein